MFDHNPDNSIQAGISEACLQKRYSAKELGEMMNTSPISFPSMDMGWQTEWYNIDFIEEVFRHIEEVNRIQKLMRLITVKWQRQIDERHEKVVRFDPGKRAWTPYVENLPDKLDEVFNRVLEYRKHKEEEEQLAREWMQMYANTTQTDAPQMTEPSTTKSPVLEEASAPKYHLADFDKEKLRILLIDDDETFSLFVEVMRNDVWPFVMTNKNKYCNALKFTCVVNDIVATYTTMPQFDNLLQEIIPGIGSQLSSMKQRKDANDKKNIERYKNPKLRKMDSCYKLSQDCPALEEKLQPVIERLQNNQ